MEQKLFKAPFSTEGRVSRFEYILTFLIYIGVDIVCDLLLGSPNSSVLYGIILIILFYIFICQSVKRCHDIGKAGWWILIPFFVLWLLFAKGDKGENDYDIESISEDDNIEQSIR